MTIERLDEQVRLPYDRAAIESGDPTQLADFLYELVKELENVWLTNLHTTVNLILDLTAGDWIYFGFPSDDEFEDGTWRFGVVSGKMELQKKISGTWQKAATWDRT